MATMEPPLYSKIDIEIGINQINDCYYIQMDSIDLSYSEELKFDQIQQLLAEQLQDAGMVDQIKIQLRQDFIKLLQNKQQKIERPVNYDKLWTKLVQCFVANYLKIMKYDHTLAIFLPECHLSVKDMVDTQDLCTLVGMDVRQYEDYLLQISNDSLSALEIMISLSQKEKTKDLMDHSTQTEDRPLSYEQRMQQIQDDYFKRMDVLKLNSTVSMEEKIMMVRKQCEKKYHEQLQSEIEKIKSLEIPRMRVEERESLKKTLRKERERLHEEYTAKLDDLKQKEKDVLQRLQMKMQIMERENMEQRQKIIKELDDLEAAKIKFHRHKCEDSQVVQDQLEEVEQMKKELRKQLEMTQQDRLKARDEMKGFIEGTVKKMAKGKENIDQPNYQGRVDEIRIQEHQKQQIKDLETHQDYLQNENQTLHRDVRQLQKEKNDLLAENDLLRHEISNLKDQILNEQDHAVKVDRQNSILVVEASKFEQLAKDLELKLSILRDEQIALQRNHQSEMDQQHQKLLQLEKDYTYRVNNDMKGYLSERGDLVAQIHGLENHIEDLMQERDSLRRIIRDKNWEKKQQQLT